MEKITLTGIDSVCDIGTHSNAMDPTAEICGQKEGMQVCVHTHTHTHTHTEGYTSKWHQDWDQIYLATSFLRLSFFCRPQQRKTQEEKVVQRKSYCFFEVICWGVNWNLNVMLFTLGVTCQLGWPATTCHHVKIGPMYLEKVCFVIFFIWKKLTSPFKVTDLMTDKNETAFSFFTSLAEVIGSFAFPGIWKDKPKWL